MGAGHREGSTHDAPGFFRWNQLYSPSLIKTNILGSSLRTMEVLRYDVGAGVGLV